MRRKTHTSRKPGPTENEIALKWELDRLRKENDLLRKAQVRQGRAEGDLAPPDRGRLVRKIANMWRNCVLKRLEIEARCPHCHGWTEDQAEAAFEAWAEDWEACLF